jgi:hypothetical protein
MERATASKVQDYTAWFWLALMLVCAVIAEVAAVQTSDIGMAISGIGFAFLGAFSLFCPLSLTANVRTMLRPPANVDPRASILAGIGVILNFIGLFIRWLG